MSKIYEIRAAVTLEKSGIKIRVWKAHPVVPQRIDALNLRLKLLKWAEDNILDLVVSAPEFLPRLINDLDLSAAECCDRDDNGAVVYDSWP